MVKEVHCENASWIVINLGVLKFVKSTDINVSQPWNVCIICHKFGASKLDKLTKVKFLE